MDDSAALFEESLAWLRNNYGAYRFFVERDIVWTVQSRLIGLVRERSLPYRVFHHFPVFEASRPVVNCDLALLNADDSVALAAEFKYEPSHRRSDIWHTKFPVVFWNEGVGHDVERVHDFVARAAAPVAYAIFISEWIDWGPSEPGVFSPALLWACANRVVETSTLS